MRLTWTRAVFSILALFAIAILVRDLWMTPNPSALPRHFAILAGFALATGIVALMEWYGRRWRHYNTISAFVRGTVWMAFGIGTWIQDGGWFGTPFVILGIWEIAEHAWILLKKRPTVPVPRQST